jgi:serine kinase of HPr protein (carbohydrate metabolism regulator)
VDRLKTAAGHHQTLDTNMKTLAAAREAGDRLVNAIHNAVMEEEGRDRGYSSLVTPAKSAESILNERPITLTINGEF